MEPCVICLQGFNLSDRIPKSLPCGHSVCAYDVTRLYHSQGRIECPYCRIPYFQAPEELPDNVIVKGFLSDFQVICETHRKECEYFCVFHFVGICSQCQHQEPDCITKEIATEQQEINILLMGRIQDTQAQIPPNHLSAKTRGLINERMRSSLAKNVNLLLQLNKTIVELNSVQCNGCGGIAIAAVEPSTLTCFCQTCAAQITPGCGVGNVVFLENQDIGSWLQQMCWETLKYINFFDVSPYDIATARDNLHLMSPIQVQEFGKQLLSKIKPRSSEADVSALTECSCPCCGGVVPKRSDSKLVVLPCGKALHAICWSCASQLQNVIPLICPIDGCGFSISIAQLETLIPWPSKSIQRIPISTPGDPNCTRLPALVHIPLPFGALVLDRFHSVLPPVGFAGQRDDPYRGWGIINTTQVEVLVFTCYANVNLLGIGLGNPIDQGQVAVVEYINIYRGIDAIANPVYTFTPHTKLVGINEVVTYILFDRPFPVLESTQYILKLKIIGEGKTSGFDLYRGNPYERPDLATGPDELAWEFDEGRNVPPSEYLNGQNNLSGPILRFIYQSTLV